MKHFEGVSRTVISYDDLWKMGVSYSREHLRRLEAAGNFPRRIRLSPCRIVWDLSEVMAWLNDRAEARNLDQN